ncbi:protein of unknown function [Serratia sp. Tan611]|nr:protein of unknown function [Serratia sp. Tan611]
MLIEPGLIFLYQFDLLLQDFDAGQAVRAFEELLRRAMSEYAVQGKTRQAFNGDQLPRSGEHRLKGKIDTVISLYKRSAHLPILGLNYSSLFFNWLIISLAGFIGKILIYNRLCLFFGEVGVKIHA